MCLAGAVEAFREHLGKAQMDELPQKGHKSVSNMSLLAINFSILDRQTMIT